MSHARVWRSQKANKRERISLFLPDSHKTRGNPFPLQVQSAAKWSAVIGLDSLPASRDNKE